MTAKDMICALVAQLDRVLDYESRGRGFESLRAHHKNKDRAKPLFLFLWLEGFEQTDARSAEKAGRGQTF